MNLREAEQLLVKASIVDNRIVSELLIREWHEILEPFDYEEARRALVEHRRNSVEYLVPAHIVAQIRKAKQRHRELYGVHPAPPPGKRWAVDALSAPEPRELGGLGG